MGKNGEILQFGGKKSRPNKVLTTNLMFEDMHFTMDPQPKLNVHKTFTRLSKRYKNALRTLNLGCVSRIVLRTHANI